ncbi:AAC(3) family N-acetyltransferase [Aneurinibacillus terranovensis]|uniref:AAC(3) family N-acetyltransferase n=1 Tax=Aneurinibacillus terranovensis TaxID=278991 RepID=UPI00040E115C|nr:AAC(3) family N-acetyltransferase [Aneurinibacillus terranovensis]
MSGYISYTDIVNNLDINPGDIVLIGSDITHLVLETLKNGEKFDSNIFIDSFINKIGTNGTLLFPTYNWGFCSGDTFDYNKTASLTGSLTNAALKRKDFIRTKHPIYSFAVWGKDRQLLFELENKSAFGEDSPFSYLIRSKGKMLLIGIDYQCSFTFVHHVEEMEKVNYRFMKDFTGTYIDERGHSSMRTYSMYVRDLNKGVVAHINPIGQKMEELGVSSLKKINNVEFYLIDLHRAFKVIQDDIRLNSAQNLYKIQKSEDDV